MRIAALYDIHGNLGALNEVLQEVDAAGVDEIVVGGDVVPGPFPAETLDVLLAIETPIHFIRGNGDREVVATAQGRPSTTLPASVQEVIQWTVDQLTPQHLELMARWPLSIRRELPELGSILFCHATPRDDNEIFIETTPSEVLLPLFQPANANLVLCGHTHMQFDRSVGDTRVVNPGSVGMPFGAPGAYWALVGREVEPKRTAVAVDSIAAEIASSRYPGAPQFAQDNILNPPSRDTMLEIFERSAVG